MRRTRSFVCALALAAPVLFLSSESRGSSAYEYPEVGTEPMGRGGAWVARASNPLATYLNPAGLAGQRTAVLLNVNLIWQKNCFKRRFPNGAVATFESGAYQYPSEVCNSDSGTPFPNPQIAFAYRISDKLGIGLGLLGPSARGKFTYPETEQGLWVAQNREREVPSSQRYLLVKDDLLLFWPQVGVGYEVIDDLRVGASFIWGLARLKFSAYAAGTDQGLVSPEGYPVDSFNQDVRADLDVKDLFVPGFTLGVLYSPLRTLDVGAWYMWTDDVKATGDAKISGPRYESNLSLTPDNRLSVTETSGDKVKMIAPFPMQARLGVRYHQPRADARGPDAPPTGAPEYRDPLTNDVFDVELDFTWANNSRFQELQVFFEPGVSVAIDPITVDMPPNASIPHHWKDTFGVRLGGDYVVIPDTFAVRAGGFFVTEGQDPRYLHMDYVPSQMFGLNAGATVRFALSETLLLDALVGYGHVFFKGLDNEGDGRVFGLQGGGTGRTTQAINGGSNSASVNIASVGANLSF